MAKDVKAFLKTARRSSEYRPVTERVSDYKDVVIARPDDSSKEQASRCMDCGTPFCHWGCPLGNVIPEWNDLVMSGKWQKAFDLLRATNNFPEITGRVCPALCEAACVLGLNDEPVTVRENELAVIEYAFKTGYIKPRNINNRTGKKVAVVGSGPAGLACADELNAMGHSVTVFERDAKAGGFMRYGIPDFKLEKWILDRRVDLMEKEGVEFVFGTSVGSDKYKTEKLLKGFDAVCLACGSRTPRDINIDGRNSKGIYFAVDYLSQSNRKVSGENISGEIIDAKDKKVVVIGGGDTGSDCVGTANRQGAKSVLQIEVMPQPSESRACDYPWPLYPLILRTSSSHKEGVERKWSVLTKRFFAENGHVKKLQCANVAVIKNSTTGNLEMKEVPGTEFDVEADLVVIAAGFLHTEKTALISEMNLALDARGNVKTDDKYKTSCDKVFSAGDMRRGQSLVVWGIYEGRQAAKRIGEYLGE